MRHRTTQRLPDRCDIARREQVNENALGEPIHEKTAVATDVPCGFNDESTSFVREDSGERVQRPATVRFGVGVEIREGDTLNIDGVGDELEVRGVDQRRDKRRGRTVAVVVEVERV